MIPHASPGTGTRPVPGDFACPPGSGTGHPHSEHPANDNETIKSVLGKEIAVEVDESQAVDRVSPAHLSRTLRTTYGLRPTDFVADLRLEHAASLLAATTDSIAEVAVRCGFSSQSYFTRCFTAADAVSPRTFRHQAQRAFVP